MTLQRKITYRMYPNAGEQDALDNWLGLHCRVSNTLIEEHRRRHASGESRYHFSAMCKELTIWRRYAAALRSLNAQSLQVTARRVALAFDAFFRRVKSGEEPGFPRFKSPQRFSGWGYKTYGDGWKLFQSDGKHGKVRLSGMGKFAFAAEGALPAPQRRPR